MSNKQLTTTTTQPTTRAFDEKRFAQVWDMYKGNFPGPVKPRRVPRKPQKRFVPNYTAPPPIYRAPSTSTVRRGGQFNALTIPKTTMSRTRVTHSEMISTVNMINGFYCTSYLINPGRSIFGWLSSWAGAFDKWSLVSLNARFVPRTSYLQVGSVYLGIDYDVMDDVPGTEVLLSQTSGIISASAYTAIAVRYDTRRLAAKDMYILRVNSDEDRWGDAGQLLIGVAGSGVFYAGNVWVDYVIDLLIPQPYEPNTSVRAGYEVTDPLHPGVTADPANWPLVGNTNTAVPLDALFSNGIKRGSTADALHIDNAFASGAAVILDVMIKGQTADDMAWDHVADFFNVGNRNGVQAIANQFETVTWADNTHFNANAQYKLTPSVASSSMEWWNAFSVGSIGQLLALVVSYTVGTQAPLKTDL